MGNMLVLAMVQWGFLTAVIAHGKRRNAALWFLIGAALPVIGIIGVLAVSTPRRRVPVMRHVRAMLRTQRAIAPKQPATALPASRAAFQA